MGEFCIALVLFLASHAAPTALGLKQAAIARIGRGPYLALYSLLSIALLTWVVTAALRAPYWELWPPSALTALPALLFGAPALFLLISGLTRPNPLSISFARGRPDSIDPGALALTRHPVLWGFGLWSGAHLIANGDLVAVILFGVLTLFAIMGARGLDRRAKRRLDPAEWIAARTRSAGSRRARLSRLLTWRTGLEALIAIALFGALLWSHERLIGVDPLAAFP